MNASINLEISGDRRLSLQAASEAYGSRTACRISGVSHIRRVAYPAWLSLGNVLVTSDIEVPVIIACVNVYSIALILLMS